MRASRSQEKPALVGKLRRPWRRVVAIGVMLPLVAGVLIGVSPTASLPVAEAAVPTPDASHAVITVRVGGDRVANSTTVTGLAGVKLSLYGAGTASIGDKMDVTGPTQGTMGSKFITSYPLASWSVCTSDAAGDCSFIVPISAVDTSELGVPADTRFWIAQDPNDAPPSGWYPNPQLRLGSPTASPEYIWGYRFRTDTQLRAKTTYTSTALMTITAALVNPDLGFMRNRPTSLSEGYDGPNISRTTGIWSQSRVNPVLPTKCGLKVAMVIDTSGSLFVGNDDTMVASKKAMGAFVDAFQGTPSTMSLFSFSNISPGDGATNNPIPLPVTTAAQGTAFKAQYASWVAGGGTNWDQGLAAAANSGNPYDLVVMLTDGNPTLYAPSPGLGSSAFTALQDVDAGIFSANQLKAAGSRVVALGVGPAVTVNSELNLRAITGTTKGQDYFNLSTFDEAATVMANLAKGNCQGSVQVQKMIVPTNGTIAQATPAPAGWQFTAASQQSANVSVNAPASQTTTAASNGIVNFGLTFTNPFTNGDVKINETQQYGYSLFPIPVSGQNAVCTNVNTGFAVTVANDNTAATPGFTVKSQSGALILCKIYNTPIAPGALVVAKTSTPTSGTVVNPGSDVSYTLSFKNTGGLPVAVNYTDYLKNVLDDSTWKSGPTVSPLNALTAIKSTTVPDTLSITGNVAPGQTVTVSYKVTANAATTGDGILLNMLGPTTVTPPTACVPGADPTWLCTIHPIKGSFSLVKSSAPVADAQVAPGDTITYTVNATDADGPVTGIVIKDDLSAVLNNATFVPGSATLTIDNGTPVSVADPTSTSPSLLQTAPFNLTTNQSAVLTYKVTFNANAWSKTLVNVVTGADAAGTLPTSCLPCTTTHTTPAKLLIAKIGESGKTTWVPMDGSSWSVFNDNAGQVGTAYEGTVVIAVVPAAIGQFQLSKIPAGTYWLTETKAPSGFNLLAEPVQFTISASGVVTLGQGAGSGVVTVAADTPGTGLFIITVRDVPALKLPASGGGGTLSFMAGGSGLVLASLALFVGIRRRQHTTD